MFHVIKANGQREPFNEEKVLISIQRAGVPKDIQQDVLTAIKKNLREDTSTATIYHQISEFLAKSPVPYAQAKYSLKQAIMDLGPTGYPFEDFIAEILTTQGYDVAVRQILMGKCVSHEVDVIAKKDGIAAMIEAKFHNGLGVRSDVRVPMYVKSRFDDLKEKHNLTEAWVVTNTKVTSDAVAFATCVGIKVISWSYPEQGGSLRDLIEQSGLHPITVLTSLATIHKTTLLENHIVRCKAIHDNPAVLDILPLSREEKDKVLQEIAFVCRNETHN